MNENNQLITLCFPDNVMAVKTFEKKKIAALKTHLCTSTFFVRIHLTFSVCRPIPYVIYVVGAGAPITFI